MEIETYTAAFNQSDWRDQARKARFKDPIQGGLEAVRMWGQQCDLLLSDKPLIGRLKARHFTVRHLFGALFLWRTHAHRALISPCLTFSFIGGL